MKRIICSLVCLLAISSVFAPASVNARPLYLSVFKELYFSRGPQVKVGCAACHPNKSKANKNRYGKALAAALGEKNVKDRKRIRQAMKSIEHQFPRLPKSGD